ncbi:MAG: Ig-like domain-containing protein [Sporichthyaceae bacterium]|nr:Ig-like domain-containing protein [Sporichthyaceae bacterium]
MVATAVAVALTASACSGSGSSGPKEHPGAVLDFEPDNGLRQVRPDRPISVVTPNGRLTAVTLSPDGAGAGAGTGVAKLTGAFSSDGRTWTYGGGLQPGAAYTMTAEVIGPNGKAVTERSTFKTFPATKLLEAEFTPKNGETVGVGHPVSVKFNVPVQNKAAVERRLLVSSSKPATGTWHWVSDNEVRFRPKDYWPSHSKVRVTASLAGVDAGGGAWGTANKVQKFDIGRSMVSVVNVNTHQMKVYRDDKLIRTIPITSGKPGWATRGGTKVVLAKDYVRVMDGSTVGAYGSEAYRLTVYYAVRVTWSGEFVHAAPWSVGSQGYANVSHGCVGMSTPNGRWFYDQSMIGDVIRVDGNEDKPMELDNGFGDWNLSWKEWSKGSALA